MGERILKIAPRMSIALSSTALADRYTLGMALARKAEHDRAHQLLAECVVADPANIEFVEGLLQNLARKARQAGGVAVPNEDLQANLSRAAAEQDWQEVLRLGPQCLFANPWHEATLLALADASAAASFDEPELRYLKMAYEADPRSVAINRQRGRSLARMKKFDEAIDCWQRVSELAPGDEEAARMVTTLSIEKSRERGEKERKSPPSGESQQRQSPEHSVTPRKAAVREHDTDELDLTAGSPGQPIPIEVSSAGAPPGEIRLTPIQELEAAIRDYPSNPEYYVELVPMYLERGRDYDAERLLAKGKTATDDLRVHQLWEDVAMLRMSRKIALARQIAAKGQDLEAEAYLAELCRERDRFETEVFVSRSLRDPKNAAIRLQLGLRLRQAGRVREALECFSEALHDPAQKPLAALEMGRSHEELREYPEALQRYRLAAEAAAPPEQIETKKQALYLAGGLARRIKMQRLSQRYLGELVRLDPNYKDAAAWLKELPQ